MMRALRAVLLVPLLLAVGSAPAAADGPWRGQVVDAETDRPLEGVVVLGVWDKVSPGMIHERREFHDVDEVVTDAQGRFVIPARTRRTLNPLVGIDGPNLEMFKAGYGQRRGRGLPPLPSKVDVWQLMEKGGVVFELPALKTWEQRRRAVPALPFGVPDAKMPRFMRAIDQERRFLHSSPK